MKTVVVLAAAICLFAGCGPALPEGRSHFDKYDVCLGSRVPKSATNITSDLWMGVFNLSEKIKCHVPKSDFVAFAKQKDWELRSDTYSYNSRTKRDEGGDPVSWLVRERDGTTPTNYLSYNYIYTNNGGITVLYDVDREIMYYSDSTN